MCQDIFIADNGLNRAVPGALNAAPDLGVDSAKLTNANKDTDTTVTVVPGKTYLLFAAQTGGFIAGFADVTQAANVKYAAALGGGGVVINVPLGKTTLHYAALVNAAVGYLIPLVRQ